MSRLRHAVIYVLLFAVGFFQFPLRVVGYDFSNLPGDLVDARLNQLILEHGYRYFRGDESEFWHVRVFYPARWVTAFSDAHLGMLPVYGACRVLGCSQESALQVWYLLPFALNYGFAAWSASSPGA